MKFIIGAIIIFTGAFVFTIYDIMKTVGIYDREEEKRMRNMYDHKESVEEISKQGEQTEQ